MKTDKISIKSVVTIPILIILMLISNGCTNNDLYGKWDLKNSCINQKLQIEFTKNILTITFYDGCQQVNPLTIGHNTFRFRSTIPKGEKKLCKAHTPQVNEEGLMEELEGKFYLTDENGMFILMQEKPAYFERIRD